MKDHVTVTRLKLVQVCPYTMNLPISTDYYGLMWVHISSCRQIWKDAAANELWILETCLEMVSYEGELFRNPIWCVWK